MIKDWTPEPAVFAIVSDAPEPTVDIAPPALMVVGTSLINFPVAPSNIATRVSVVELIELETSPAVNVVSEIAVISPLALAVIVGILVILPNVPTLELTVASVKRRLLAELGAVASPEAV